MALRAFRCNPALGGFGNETAGVIPIPTSRESSATSRGTGAGASAGAGATGAGSLMLEQEHGEACDAFAQILKELVDNAVDACTDDTIRVESSLASRKSRMDEMNRKSSSEDDRGDDDQRETMKRVRVRIEAQEYTVPAPIPQANDNDSHGTSTGVRQGITNHTAQAASFRKREILRVKVCDNGCGMEDIQKCVSVFSTSKADIGTCTGSNESNTNNSGAVPAKNYREGGDNSKNVAETKQTAGRYGIGLTLCILHAQRLVPGSCAMIRSAVRSATHWTEARFVVDTEQDAVVCVKKETFRKNANEKSGTEVNLLVPGGVAAQKAWPRLAEYFSRFQLSLGMKCSLEVMAPSLSRIPLYVRPPYEEEQRKEQQKRQRQRQQRFKEQNLLPKRVIIDVVQSKCPDEDEKIQKKEGSKSGAKSNVEKDFCDIFSHQGEEQWDTLNSFASSNMHIGTEKNDDRYPTNEFSESTSNGLRQENEGRLHCRDLDEEFLSSSLADVTNIQSAKPKESTSIPSSRIQMKQLQKVSAKRQLREENIKRRIQMKDAVESYLKKPIDLANVAHSKQKIRRPDNTGDGKSSSSTTDGGPTLDIDIIVSKHDDENDSYGSGIEDENDSVGSSSPVYFTDPTIDSKVDQSKAKIILIRMVNRIPLLDSVEASACGVVRGLLRKQLWNSFGLDISNEVEEPTVTTTARATRVAGNNKDECNRGGIAISLATRLYVPTFALGDSAHVAPFFSQNNTHSLFDDDGDGSSSESDEESLASRTYFEGTKRKRKKKMCLKPAGLRLGNILIIVQLNAKSSQLPLPTLSKGRLPMNDAAIDNALQAGLGACLRSLQETNPSLLLTPAQLKKTERDVLYVPSIASAFAAMTLNCQDTRLRQEMITSIEYWRSSVTGQGDEGESTSQDSALPLVSSSVSCKDNQLIQRGLCLQIEDRIIQALKFQEEERNRAAMERSKLKKGRRSKKKKKQEDKEECSTTSGSNYDLDEFLSQSTSKKKDQNSINEPNHYNQDGDSDNESVLWNEDGMNLNKHDDDGSKCTINQERMSATSAISTSAKSSQEDTADFDDDWL